MAVRRQRLTGDREFGRECLGSARAAASRSRRRARRDLADALLDRTEVAALRAQPGARLRGRRLLRQKTARFHTQGEHPLGDDPRRRPFEEEQRAEEEPGAGQENRTRGQFRRRPAL